MMVQIAFSVCRRDEKQALQTLEWAHTLDGQTDYDCVLSIGQGVNDAPILAAAKKLFRVVTVLRPEPPLQGNPQEKNWCAQDVFRWMHANHRRESLLWVEPDSIPLCKGWLTKIEKAHVDGGKPFTGPWHEALGFMECIGVWPGNFQDISPEMGMRARAVSWDRVCGPDVSQAGITRINHLIQCCDNIDGFPPTFEDKDDLKLIRPGVVLFHRNKDGTLVEQLSAGRWKRFFSFSFKTRGFTCVSLRRAGDIISLLPAVQSIAAERKKTVKMVVHRDFVPLFDGMSYAEPIAWDGDWEDPLTAAEAHSAVNAQVVCRNIMPDWQFGNFAKDAWKMLGRTWNRYAPVQFDRRVPAREAELADQHLSASAPNVLVKLHGHSSAFKDALLLRARLEAEVGDRARLVWLDEIQVPRIYDMIGLLDRAALLISVDTVALHLAGASRCPVVAIVNARQSNTIGFSATPPRGNQVLRVSYGDALSRFGEIRDTLMASLETATNDRMVLVYHCYTPRSAEGQERNHRAMATWPALGARLHPFVPRRTSATLGDQYAVPFFKDMLNEAFASGSEDIVVLSNNDIVFDQRLGEAIRRSCVANGCYWSYRLDREGGSPDGGVDVIGVTRAWWRLHQRQLPDFLFGNVWWDNAVRRVMIWSGCPEGDRFCYHAPHAGVNGRRGNVGEQHNRKLAADWLAAWQEAE